MSESRKKSSSTTDAALSSGVHIGLSAVIVAADEDMPRVFIVRGAKHPLASMDDTMPVPGTTEERIDALPFGPFDPLHHTTLEKGLRRWVEEQTPLRPGYVEQLYTFGNRGRYASEDKYGLRVVSVGYLALTYGTDHETSDREFWQNWYVYFPWEDRRNGIPDIIPKIIEPALKKWAKAPPSKAEQTTRLARIRLCFGLEGVRWDEEKTLERYELLYEARLVPEVLRDRPELADENPATVPGRPMQFDHRRILATAMGRLRGKLKYRPVIFELMPEKFTLLQLQKTVEAIAGIRLHKQNFRRLIESAGLVEETAETIQQRAGRPAALFRFRRDILLERQAAGVRLSPVS